MFRFLILLFFSLPLFGLEYLDEQRTEKNEIFIFSGEVDEKNIPEIKYWQRQYIETFDNRYSHNEGIKIEKELYKYGVSVKYVVDPAPVMHEPVYGQRK